MKTKYDKQEIIKLYVEEKKTMTEIQRLLGIDRHCVADILKENGIDKNNRNVNLNFFIKFDCMENLKEKGVYIITNKVNGKVYVGSTVSSFFKRWCEHKMDWIGDKHTNNYFQKSFNKYGLDSFDFKILKILDNDEDIIWYENYYIKLFDSTIRGKGYNLCPEAKLPSISKSKAVYMLDLDGNIVKEYNSLKDAENENNIFNVYIACNKKRIKKNHYWCFKEEYNKDNYKTPYYYVIDRECNIILKTIISNDIKNLLNIDKYQLSRRLKNMADTDNNYIFYGNDVDSFINKVKNRDVICVYDEYGLFIKYFNTHKELREYYNYYNVDLNKNIYNNKKKPKIHKVLNLYFVKLKLNSIQKSIVI